MNISPKFVFTWMRQESSDCVFFNPYTLPFNPFSVQLPFNPFNIQYIEGQVKSCSRKGRTNLPWVKNIPNVCVNEKVNRYINGGVPIKMQIV